MTETIDQFDAEHEARVATEKMVYGIFRREQTVFRLGDIPRKLLDRATIQLPTNSVLHSLDNLLTPKDPAIALDTTEPMIRNEGYIVYLHHHTQIPDKEHPLFPVTDRYRFVASRFLPQIQKFYQTNKDVRRVTALDIVIGRPNVLTVINYNAILDVYLQGRMQTLRRFDIALRTILASIVDIEAMAPGKLHHLQIPLSGDVYSKVQLDRTFKELTMATVRVWDDLSFFFLIHFFGYLTDGATTILPKLPQTILDRLHIVFTCGEKTIIYNLGDLKALMGTNKNFYIQVLRHINSLKLIGSESVSDDALTDEMIDAHVAAQAIDDEKILLTEIAPETPDTEPEPTPPTVTNQQPAAAPISSVRELPTKDATPPAPAVKPFHVQLQDDVQAAVDTVDVPLSKVQKERALQSPDRLKEVMLGGRSVAELIAPAADPDIRGREVTALPAAALPDPSMRRSAIVHFDQIYVEQQLPRDIATVLTSFSAAGMFLNDLREVDEVSEFNRIRNYTAVFTDVTGKRHTVRFKLPIIDRDGTILLNGVRSRMIKQQVNLPIVKVSDTRVNLASNYNKTLVERSAGQAHRFDVHLTRYLGALSNAGKVKLDYGHTVIEHPVAYDYACLAERYLGMTVGAYKFTFNYPQRLAVGATEAYIETDSTMTHNGTTYNLTTLFRSVATLAIQPIKVADLKRILQSSPLNEPGDAERIKAADLSKPILVAQIDGRWVVVDGMHRLAKAAAKGVDTLPAKVVPASLLEKHRLTPGDELLLLKTTSLRGREVLLQSVYCGTRGDLPMYYGDDNVIRVIDLDGKTPDAVVREAFTIRSFLKARCETADLPLPKAPVEWTELKLLDRSFPIIFVLGYQFGLSTILQKLGHPYRFIPTGSRQAPQDVDELAITFADGKLVFPRYPLKTGLILGGLDRFDLRQYVFSHMDMPDTYFTLLAENRFSTNYLKGIKDFFRFFVDPITRDVLLRMGEPVTPEGLLLRATAMLDTKEHRPAASMQNHRVRGYERFADILYNELARELARQDAQRVSKKRQFSLNPDKVLYAVAQDATVQPVEDINPIHDLKTKSQVTYSGQGGRSGRSMMVADRNFPADGTGILSEATPDSSKVAINAYFSVDPVLSNIRGMYQEVDLQQLEPTNILSASALLIPGVTTDDAKRIGYVGIQLSHHVPCQNGETLRVRTGYEKIIAHQTSETFAGVAREDGVVEAVDDDLKLIRVKYAYEPPKPQGDLPLNLTRMQVDAKVAADDAVFIVVRDTAAATVPVGKDFSLNGRGLFRVVEVLPFPSTDDLPAGWDAAMTSTQVRQLAGAKSVLYVKLQPVKDNPTERIDIFRYGDQYTTISGSYLTQTLVPTVKVGDVVKQGDVLVYNSGFFEKDPDSRQVDWKHGVVGTIVFIDRSETYEDSCEISQSFAAKLTTSPGHARVLELTNNTVIHSMVALGDAVETTDYLAVVEDGDLDAISADDPDTLDMLVALNRKMPRAKYHGKIVDIQLYHACEYADLHPSLQKLAKQLARRKIAYHQAYAQTSKADTVPLPQKVPLGTKYMGVDFSDVTQVALVIIIADELTMGVGDKAVLFSSAKTTVAAITEKTTTTESGRPVDMLFSASGIANRMLLSPITAGIGQAVLESLEKEVVKTYFGD